MTMKRPRCVSSLPPRPTTGLCGGCATRRCRNRGTRAGAAPRRLRSSRRPARPPRVYAVTYRLATFHLDRIDLSPVEVGERRGGAMPVLRLFQSTIEHAVPDWIEQARRAASAADARSHAPLAALPPCAHLDEPPPGTTCVPKDSHNVSARRSAGASAGRLAHRRGLAGGPADLARGGVGADCGGGDGGARKPWRRGHGSAEDAPDRYSLMWAGVVVWGVRS